MNLLVLDLETFYSNEFTLKKLSTEEYCRDPRFRIHMVGYYAPALMAAPATCLPSLLDTNAAFRTLIETSAVVCHHAQFDLLALNHWHGLRPAFILDTLAMARLVLPRLKSHSLEALAQHFALPSKTVPYNLFRGLAPPLPPEIYAAVADGCAHDCHLTAEIVRRLLPLVPKEELRVIDCTVRMFTEPTLRLDRPRMASFLQAERLRKAKAMLAAGEAIGYRWDDSSWGATAEGLRIALDHIETELQSSDKFRVALESLGYPCPMKWSEKQQLEIPALAKNDDGMQELLEHGDSRVSALASARLGVKSTIDETRAQRLLDTDQRGPLPVYLAYAAAKTLRFGGGDKTNWQNFRRGGEIRQSILAPEGHKLVIGDLSQIEYRLLCWLTGQIDKLDALVAGRDLYCEHASLLYDRLITKEDKLERTGGKVLTLQAGYGAGSESIQRAAGVAGVALSDEQALFARNLYRREHPLVPAFWAWCDAALPILASGGETTYSRLVQPDGGAEPPTLVIKNHKIWLPNGTALDYTGLKWACNTDIFPDQQDDGQGYAWWEPTRKGWARIWGSKLTADIVQGLARVVIVACLTKIAKRYKVALQVHDELVQVVLASLAEECAAFVHEVMVTPPEWCSDIPLQAEVIVSERYDK